MKENNSKKFLIIAVIILAVLNVTTFATIGYYFYSSKKQTERYSRFSPGDEQAAFSNRWFSERLHMDNGQVQQLGRFNMGFRGQAREINGELLRYRREMLDEMEKDSPDTVRLNMLSDSIGKLHSDLKRFTYKYYLDLKKISSPEQETELHNMFRQEFLNEMPMGAGPRQQMQNMGRRNMGRSGAQQNN